MQTARFHFKGALLQSFIETKHPCDDHNSCAGKQISSTFICICCSVFGFTTTMHMQHASSAAQNYFTVCLKPRLNMLSFPEFPASRIQNYKHIQKPSKTRDHAVTFAGFSTPKVSRVTEGANKTRGTLKQSKKNTAEPYPQRLP